MRTALWVGGLVVLLGLCALAVALGPVALSLGEVRDGLVGVGDPNAVAIVRAIRLPRLTLALIVGAALGMAGAALQGSLRNALAEPYLLGVSGGAAVGAVLAFGAGVRDASTIPIFACLGGGAAVGAVLLIARAAGGRADPRVLIMAGVIMGAFANAVIMVVLANAPPNTVRGAVWWMMGSVADAGWAQIRWLAAYVLVGAIALLLLARQIDVLALGEEPAAALGLDVDRSARRIYLASSLLAAATVAAAGLIGFVGLMVPHIVRAFGVRRHRAIVAGAALVGAALLVAADLVARTAMPPAELPLGAVTALLGVPFFLLRIRKLA
ncbi:MAG TPA: iron ABC transporter permease [Gemmatimonadaceae bacterium]|nr:iron ABC transporter permease [Gemmatimonadaceae bacterium]